MRIFLDANILFSAAKSAGAVRQLLDELRALGHECLADDYVIGEARRNLKQKFPASVADLDRTLASVTSLISPPPADRPNLARLLPVKDRPVLASAIHHRCDALLTGDRTHFGALHGKTIAGVTIHSPQSLAEES